MCSVGAGVAGVELLAVSRSTSEMRTVGGGGPAREGGDEDSTTNDTSIPTPASTSPTPFGSITRAQARRITHQVSSLLSSGASYLDKGDTCTLVLLRNNGLDLKGRGIAQAGFRLQDRHDL
jgi:hypothetical protein